MIDISRWKGPRARIRQVLAGSILLVMSDVAWGVDNTDPAQTVRTVVEAVFKASATGPKHLQAAVERHVGPRLDPLVTARIALGPHWRRASDSERQRVAASIHRMVLSGLALALQHTRGAQVKIVAVRQGSDTAQATVQTRVRRESGPPVSIDYRLRNNAGIWKLHDLVIEGVSMLNTYRRSFTTRVRRVGLANFVDELEARVR